MSINSGKNFCLNIISISNYSTDSQGELQMVVDMVSKFGATAVVSEHWEKGGEGGQTLAKAVIAASEKKNAFK